MYIVYSDVYMYSYMYIIIIKKKKKKKKKKNRPCSLSCVARRWGTILIFIPLLHFLGNSSATKQKGGGERDCTYPG